MTIKVNNIIWMIWKNKDGESFKVGELSKRPDKYYFRYDIEGVKKAEAYGFLPLPYFPIIDAKYFREGLFRSFSKRLPGHGKKDINSVLKEYNLKKYDDLKLLEKSGGAMPTDSFEFRSPFDKEGVVLDKEKIVLSKEDGVLGKEGVVLDKEDIVLDKEDIVLDKEDIVLDKKKIVLDKKKIVLNKEDSALDNEKIVVVEK